jgi:hypothetical protein
MHSILFEKAKKMCEHVTEHIFFYRLLSVLSEADFVGKG